MKMTDKQRTLYDTFYESTIDDGVLGAKTGALVGLAAAMASSCEPCMAYYVSHCRKNGVTDPEMQAVLAKVMAVAAGQKRLQAEKVLKNYEIDFD